MDMGGMLLWQSPHCDLFRNVLAHPKLLPVMHTLLGKGYRLDHQPIVIAQDKDRYNAFGVLARLQVFSCLHVFFRRVTVLFASSSKPPAAKASPCTAAPYQATTVCHVAPSTPNYSIPPLHYNRSWVSE
jgi:hypothetical protein